MAGERATVRLEPYSAQWPAVFANIRDELLQVFPPGTVAIEHIGSTAVPGLSAKPVIDVLLGAESLAVIEARIADLVQAGYEYVSKHERVIPMRRYFVAQPLGGLRVHVHGVQKGAAIWQEHLAFRDALLADPQLRDRYQSLKRQLAETFAEDKAAYTDAKAPFIRNVLAAFRASSPA